MLIRLHGIASRRDLPLPSSCVVVGAVLALVISFAILIFAWRQPRFQRVGGPPIPVGSLRPVVLGYVVAHYATLLIVEGQRVAINFSDPLGRGWNVFRSAEIGVNSAIFKPSCRRVPLSGGHVFGIVCAHEKAVALLPPDRALRGQ